MRIMQRKVKCKKCRKKSAADWAYKFWHFVSCYEHIEHTDITWVKSWWVCNACMPETATWRDRFHDIDGHVYGFSPKFPFFRRSN